MKFKRKILPLVCCSTLLAACASDQVASFVPWLVAPMAAARNSSDTPDKLYQMGRYYQEQNRFDQAIAAYQKALAADAGYIEAHNGIAVIYAGQGKFREAIAVLQAAIRQAPQAAHLHNNLGYAYYLQGQYDASVAVLEQAVALASANQRALNNLGLAYAKVGKASESIRAFDRAAHPHAASPGALAALPPNPSPHSVESAFTDAAMPAATGVTATQPEAHMLALPKDRGVLRHPSMGPTIAVMESDIKLVQLAPNVYELQQQRYQEGVEVSNGNGVTGMAKRVGEVLRNQGYPVARFTNQKPFQVVWSQIQYRDGYQAAAQQLQSSVPVGTELVQRDDLRADVSVRLVLGKDIAARLANIDGSKEPLRLALNAWEP